MGESGSCSNGWGHAQEIFNQIFYWWAGLCSFPVVWPEAKLYRVMVIIATSFKRTNACTVVFSAPDPTASHCIRTPPPETPGHSQASLAQSLVESLLLSPGSWCTQDFFVPSKSLFLQSCGSSVIKSYWLPRLNSLGVLSPFTRSPGWEICCGS